MDSVTLMDFYFIRWIHKNLIRSTPTRALGLRPASRALGSNPPALSHRQSNPIAFAI